MTAPQHIEIISSVQVKNDVMILSDKVQPLVQESPSGSICLLEDLLCHVKNLP